MAKDGAHCLWPEEPLVCELHLKIVNEFGARFLPARLVLHKQVIAKCISEARANMNKWNGASLRCEDT